MPQIGSTWEVGLIGDSLSLICADRATNGSRAGDTTLLGTKATPLHGEALDVRKLSLGYVHDFARMGPIRWGIGALASAFRLPGAITPYYGAHPRAYMIFLQARL